MAVCSDGKIAGLYEERLSTQNYLQDLAEGCE